MPKSLTKHASINRTPEQVHQWLADWDHVHAWMGPSLVSIEMLSDHAPDAPMCAGMRFRETRKMGKMNAKAVVEVERHDLEEGTLHHRAVFDDGCNRMIAQYTYAPDGDGCSATWTIENAPNKWWTKALGVVSGPMMIKMMEKCEGDHLDKLKALIEDES